jgi:hypothetical protein
VREAYSDAEKKESELRKALAESSDPYTALVSRLESEVAALRERLQLVG